jgi:Flp pilus assembly protein TadG
MVELAILLPVLVLLFLGAWTASDLISDNNTAVQASQQGARYGAELGQGPTGATVLGVDTDIIDQMLPILNSQLTNAKVTEIDIYQPDTGVCSVSPSFSPSGGQLSRSTTCPPDNGAYNSGYGELIDEYQISGTTITPLTSQYLLTDRIQTHPNESELGVRVTIHYTSPTMAMFTQYDTQYSVVRLAPVE